ncbi:MAG: AmmeMemoRadiSam system radical SAM enzyme [Negativicutes bacterium]|nr:AmmeMemoRadiSam system radical SAM enzyme [Negativicutes bacterium]
MSIRQCQHYQFDFSRQVAHCQLCPHRCAIAVGQSGRCRARYNDGQGLVATTYGQFCSIALDPIEKKPLRHFHPGSTILSVGGRGCNLHCQFCQNWQIAHGDPDCQYIPPAGLVALADRWRDRGNIGVAFTYNEPLIAWEYIADTAPLLREAGLHTVLVSNGYLLPEPWQQLLPWIDAANIDVKAFNEQFYRRYCHGGLAEVVQTVEAAAAARHCHLEVTCLIIPGLNDSRQDMEKLADWLAGLDPGIPLHISRYFPRYRLDIALTPRQTLEEMAAVAGRYLTRVYIGNC